MNRARRALAVGIVTMGLAVAAGATSETTSPAPDLATVRRAAAGLAVPFEENRGQFEPEVAYLAKTFAGSVFVTREGQLVYSLPGRELAAAENGSPAAKPDRRERRQAERGPGWALEERLLGAGPLSPEGAEAAVTHVTRFTPAGTFQADTWERVRLGEAWTGIEVELAARGQNFEKLFHLAPGADPARIRVGLRGAERLSVADDGRLVVTTGNGDLAYTAPVAWQEIGGERRAVEVRYALLEPPAGGEEKAWGFALGAYDPQQPLTIDPLLQSTYLGGNGYDYVNTLALAANGDVLVAGYTDSSDFPKRMGGTQPANGGGVDGFVSRLTGDLRTIVQSTYLGGAGTDQINALEPNEAGWFPVVWVGGYTDSTSFPGITSSSAQQTNAGGWDGFVSCLSSDLTLMYGSTYFGGSGTDGITALAIADNGDIVVGGFTRSENLPKRANGAQPTYSGNADGFVARIRGDLGLIWQSTYLGGNDYDVITTLALAGNGDVIVGGDSESDGLLGAVFDSAQQFRAGSRDGFVSRLAGDLKSVVRSTYVGGSFEDRINALIVTGGGTVLVGGLTASADLHGISAWSAQAEYGGGIWDGFVTQLSGNLKNFLMSTYLGGSGAELIEALIEVPNVLGSPILVAGSTTSTDLPGINAASAQAIYGGGNGDGFLSYLSRFGNFWTIAQSTYLGGGGSDGIHAMARTSEGRVFVGGNTDSLDDLPGIQNGAQTNYGGGYRDGFISLLRDDLTASLFADNFETGNICRWDAARGASGTPCN
ncbi:MAG: hypothetical protein BWX64_00779 [Acidobacteria bacterium ADurb.Bin051]|nr:MAG: hypothetical protein BWX64_00779 [Acidobacteria bacterium ADurb.Bin051]